MKCEWKTLAFGDLLEEPVRNGLTKPKAIRGTGVKMIAMGEIFAYSRIANVITDRVPVTEKELQNCSIKPLDILFARQSLTLEGAGKCSIVTDVCEDTVFESHLIRTRVDRRKADPFFLYYYFNSPHGKNNIRSIVEQVSAAGIRGSDLIKLSVPCPCIEVQKKISAILRLVDDKIELNNKINENLEQQTQAIFYEWFISTPQKGDIIQTELGMIPASFDVAKTGDLPLTITDYVANGSFATLKANVKVYQEPNYAYFIRNTDLKSGTFEVYVDEHSYNFLSKSRLFGGEIIISNVGDVGSVFLCPTLDAPMTLGNNIIMLKPGKENLRYYLYIWFKWSLGQGLIQGIRSGSVQPKFNKTDFKALPVILPPHELLDKFHKTVSPMFDLIGRNQ